MRYEVEYKEEYRMSIVVDEKLFFDGMRIN